MQPDTHDAKSGEVRIAYQVFGQGAFDLVSLDLAVRGGVHTGEIEVKGDDIGGIAVHIAVRVAGLAKSNQILVSSTVRDLVTGSNLQFADRGPHARKGLDEPVRLFSVDPVRVS